MCVHAHMLPGNNKWPPHSLIALQIDSKVVQDSREDPLTCWLTWHFLNGEEEREKMQASAPLGQESGAGGPPSPFASPEFVPTPAQEVTVVVGKLSQFSVALYKIT